MTKIDAIKKGRTMHDGSTLYQDWSVSVGRQIRFDKGALSAVIRHFVEALPNKSRTSPEQVSKRPRTTVEQTSNSLSRKRTRSAPSASLLPIVGLDPL